MLSIGGAFDSRLALFVAGHSYPLKPCPKDPQPRLRAHKGTFHVILTNYRKTKNISTPPAQPIKTSLSIIWPINRSHATFWILNNLLAIWFGQFIQKQIINQFVSSEAVQFLPSAYLLPNKSHSTKDFGLIKVKTLINNNPIPPYNLFSTDRRLFSQFFSPEAVQCLPSAQFMPSKVTQSRLRAHQGNLLFSTNRSCIYLFSTCRRFTPITGYTPITGITPIPGFTPITGSIPITGLSLDTRRFSICRRFILIILARSGSEYPLLRIRSSGATGCTDFQFRRIWTNHRFITRHEIFNRSPSSRLD